MPVVKRTTPAGRTTYEVQVDGRPVPLVNDFLLYLRDRGKAVSTVRGYAYDLQYLTRFTQSRGMRFADFRPRHTVRFLRYLREDASREARRRRGEKITHSGRGGMRLSDATVARVLAAVSSFYEFLVISERYDDENPLVRVVDKRAGMVSERRRPALGESSRQQPVRRRVSVATVFRLPRPIPRQDVETLLGALKTLRDRAYVLLCVNGGLRPSEALNLRLSDIRYGMRQVIIRVLDEEDPREISNKSRTERVVDLYDEVTLKALSDYVMKERPREASTDLVFLVGRNGKRRCEPLSYHAVQKMFTRKMAALGLRTPWATLHAMRHTHATEMFEHGMREMTLQKRLGHASPASTKVYTRVSDKSVRDDYQAAVAQLRAARRGRA